MTGSNYPRIIAHRCGGALAPENSLAGLAIAARLGCRGVEFDVMLSADGVPLLIHDETLDRTSTGSGRVCELSAVQIRRFDTGGPHHPAFAVLPAPTFDEALDCCVRLGLWANVEIKPAAGYEAQTGIAVGQRLAAGGFRRGVVSSFSGVALQAARHHAPDIALALLCDELPPDWRAQTRNLAASAIHLAASAVTAEVAAELSAALPAMLWACYTVNRRELADQLFALGCRAVFTDRPDLWLPGEM